MGSLFLASPLACGSTLLFAPAVAARTVCAECTQPILSQYVTVKDKQFHNECFMCAKCKVSLAGQAFLHREGQFYCEDDFHALFSPTCSGCNLLIKGAVIPSFCVVRAITPLDHP
jgi:hypothetical protein